LQPKQAQPGAGWLGDESLSRFHAHDVTRLIATMVIALSLNSIAARVGMLLLTLAAGALLGFTTLAHFIAGALSDEGAGVGRAVLAAAAAYFPESARLQARLAAVALAEAGADEQILAQAEAAATRAVHLAPSQASHWRLLAAAKELRGDLTAAEAALRAALALAPHHTRVRWQLANLLVRAGTPEPAFAEFRLAVTADPELLPAALGLIWSVSGRDLRLLETVAGDAPQARLRLAQFLLAESQATQAADVFRRVERQARLAASATGAFLDALLAAGHLETAHQLWADSLSDHAANQPPVWNGGFETEIRPGLAQFDWQLNHSDYALIEIDAATARTGARALRVRFRGRDTTRLEGEVRQLILARPGARYRLECYVKAADLITSEGPRVAVSNRADSTTIAFSEPVAAGSYDWRRLTIEFTAPASASALVLGLKRIPRFSYDEPTRGMIWLDDVTLTEITGIQ
jgi:tetratricopeptide (TPR) repeat protein